MQSEFTLANGRKLIYSKKASKKKDGRKGFIYILYSEGKRCKIIFPRKIA
jgi:hypothetical protein